MSYIGSTPTTQGFIPAIDYFSGNGATVAFTLSRPVASVAQVQATIENVPQNPGTAFTVSGNTITFDGAPASGTNNIYVYYTSPITQVIAPSQGTVFPSTLSTGGPFWNTSGNLGVGTSSPGTRLQIGNPSDANQALRFDFSDSSTARINSTRVGAGNLQSLLLAGQDTMQFQTNGTERMRIDVSGRVTAPFQPSFTGYYNGADLGPNSTATKLNLTVITNNGSYYSSGNFTAPVAGYYYCTFSGASIYGTSGSVDISIRKNGVTVTAGYAFTTITTAYSAASCNAVVYCAANDTIEFWKNSTSTNSFQSGFQYSSASVMLIG
jgi:hypothetical protein